MGSSLEILRGRTGGQIVAILSKVCGGDEEKLDALLRDELEVKLIERVSKLADKNGRVIPAKGLKNAVCDPDKKFYLVQPSLNTIDGYANRLVYFQEAFKPGLFMSVAEFEGRANELIGQIKDNKKIVNLLNGVYLPIILPKLESIEDYGRALERIFLPAVKFSFEKQFPGRKFYSYRENELEGKVGIVEGTRHEKLVFNMIKSYVVAIYFPNPLQGFSVLASREQLFHLPESLLMAGGFDTAIALAMYPDVLARDWYTPGLDLSALSWQSSDYSLCFVADDGGLYFGSRGNLGGASGSYSSGLLFVGS
ncbi:MAG: hypothetical protein V1845_00280 [bacterium]